ncbi:MAG TPA: TolC family protein [Bacteroidales bacterium]|nr:TolC family protein [Bacteroidales bacterium]
MIKIIFFLLVFFLSTFLNAQEVITIDYCIDRAEKNYPIIKNELLIQNKAEKNLKVLNSGYLPALDFVGQATWQSDVTNIDIDVPFITEPITDVPKDQYKVALELSQVIWDGGAISGRKDLEKSNTKVEIAKIANDIYAYKEKIVDLYFNLLVLNKQNEIITIKRWQLREQIKELHSGVENGVVLQSQLDILLAEQIKIEQNLIDIEYEVLAVREMLEYLMGEEIPEFANILLPTPNIKANNSINRPEIDYFNALKMQAASSEALISKGRMPKLMAFAQLGYGRPGLNMLSDEFDTYAVVGAKFVWNIWDWNKTKRNREIIGINLQMIDNQKNQFEMFQQSQAQAQIKRIEKYDKLIMKDEEIVELRKGITSSYSSQLKNGVVRASDYIIALNEEQAAMLNLGMHEILLSKAKYSWLMAVGKQNENN